MSYITLITNAGLAKITAALAGGTQITMGQIAVGDGNGNPTIPSQTQTALVNERYRATANQIAINSDGNLVAELIVPQSVGGFTVREIALFDSSGDLFAVGSTPALQKPSVVENAAAELVIRLIVAVSNSAVIQLTSPNMIVATRDWVENNFSASAMFPGGTTGQILAKKSNLDGDTEWKDPSSVNVTVDTIEETQTLADGQTIVTLTTTNTIGVAIYIDGIRLPRSRYTVNSATQITLSQSYPAGTLITATQNEPAGQIQAIAIGQIIMLGLAADPAALFGYGTWQQVGQGRAIFGLNVSDSDFNELGKTGGSKQHAHSGATATAGSHNHGAATAAGGDHNHGSITGTSGTHSHGGTTGDTTLTADQIPSHSHSITLEIQGNNKASEGAAYTSLSEVAQNDFFASDTRQTSSIGGNQAHNHTIATDGAHAHTVASSGTHTHGINSDGTHNHSFTTNTAHILPPYFTVALWQRMS